MKQIIPFVNDVSLNTDIYEITSIALEHNLQMENEDSIVGSFIISGKYKMNEMSINEEVFEKEIPFDITLDDKYDATKVQIDIDDFYYEIVNEEFLRVHIDVLIDNLVYAKKTKLEEDKEDRKTVEEATIKENIKEDENKRCIEEEILEKQTYNLKEDESKVDTNMIEEKKEEVKNASDIADKLQNSLSLESEKYVTYKIHIIRNDETIDTIKEKYNITREELEKYNSLDNITMGSKIIVPIKDE